MLEPKPCPFCGSGDITIEIHTPYRERPRYHAKCFACGTTTSFGETESGAIHNWNNRPAQIALQTRLDALQAQVAALQTTLDEVSHSWSKRYDDLNLAHIGAAAAFQREWDRANKAEAERSDLQAKLEAARAEVEAYREKIAKFGLGMLSGMR